jgi:hypothetical protein
MCERRDSRGDPYASGVDHRPVIERALKIAGAGKPGRRMRLVFPIGPEAFFVPEGSGQREAA